jgi:hypothetical protein
MLASEGAKPSLSAHLHNASIRNPRVLLKLLAPAWRTAQFAWTNSKRAADSGWGASTRSMRRAFCPSIKVRKGSSREAGVINIILAHMAKHMGAQPWTGGSCCTHSAVANKLSASLFGAAAGVILYETKLWLDLAAGRRRRQRTGGPQLLLPPSAAAARWQLNSRHHLAASPPRR